MVMIERLQEEVIALKKEVNSKEAAYASWPAAPIVVLHVSQPLRLKICKHVHHGS